MYSTSWGTHVPHMQKSNFFSATTSNLLFHIQGYSKQLMLRLIIDAAIHWIKAGLELKSLKIVLFSRHPEKPDKSHEPLFECFQKMKDKFGDKELTYVSLFSTFCIILAWQKALLLEFYGK